MKIRRLTVVTVLLALSAVLFLEAGCTRGTSDFLSLARQNLEGSNSFRIAGNMDMSITMSGMGSDLPVEMSVPIEEEIEQSGDSFKMKAVVGMAGSFADTEVAADDQPRTTMYLIDNQLYYESMGRWNRSEFSTPLTAMGGGNNQLITPDSILRMMDTADNVETVEETGSLIRYHFTLGDKYYQDATEQFMEIMPDYPVEQYENLIKAMKYEIEVTVDKGSEQVTHLSMDMEGNDLEFMEGIKMSMKVSGAFDFTDYGKNFDIVLPDEARDATYLDSSSVNPF